METIKKLREICGFSISDMAAKCGVTYQSYYMHETQKMGWLSPRRACNYKIKALMVLKTRIFELTQLQDAIDESIAKLTDELTAIENLKNEIK